MDFRQKLLEVQTEGDFKKSLLNHAQELAAEQSNPQRRLPSHEQDLDFEVINFFFSFYNINKLT